MLFRRSTTVKYTIAACLGAAIYCEWAIYHIQQLLWTNLECSEYDASCTKVLFIADPQIQGDNAVAPPFNHLFSWDSDRYLQSTFRVAVKHFKPDVLVYLGDLTDEGSVATMKQFYSYIKRLSNIFELGYLVPQVWITGDNDIGGENEPIKQDKVKEFDKVFNEPPVVAVGNISFYRVSGITHTYPQKSDTPAGDENRLRIVVSHYPITLRYPFARQIQRDINPNIFFCAHEHESKYVEQTSQLTERKTVSFLSPQDVLTVTFDESSLYEVYVPTCSYRMGTSDIGYGAAVFENNNQQMRYTVFWSPTRFPCLFLYLVILIIFIIYSLVFCAARLLHRNNINTKSPDMSPLLSRI